MLHLFSSSMRWATSSTSTKLKFKLIFTTRNISFSPTLLLHAQLTTRSSTPYFKVKTLLLGSCSKIRKIRQPSIKPERHLRDLFTETHMMIFPIAKRNTQKTAPRSRTITKHALILCRKVTRIVKTNVSLQKLLRIFLRLNVISNVRFNINRRAANARQNASLNEILTFKNARLTKIKGLLLLLACKPEAMLIAFVAIFSRTLSIFKSSWTLTCSGSV